jgi:soluble lytic murein transglycosylase
VKRGCLNHNGWFFVIVMVLLFAMHKPIGQAYFILDYEPQIIAYSKNNNLNPALVSAIVFVESRFNARAKSHKGALGLMQIMPTTGKWVAEQLQWDKFSDRDLLNPQKNLEVGIWYLAYLKQYFKENESLALASYNAGHGNVSQWLSNQVWDGDVVKLEKIPFPETKNYIFRINFVKKVYAYLYPDLKTKEYQSSGKLLAIDPERRSDNAMCGFSRRISQSGKSCHLFQRFQMLPTPE